MLIILYGDISNKKHGKQQLMISGAVTCGYREYAKKFGYIIYMTPQDVKLPWEHVMIRSKNVIKFINKHPKAVVWSVKYSLKKDEQILSKIKNKKIYYSCNAKNIYNNRCDVSLVDTQKRVKINGKLFFKGKDPDYWLPLKEEQKEYDYLFVGLRGDKNETYFIKKLNEIKEKRKILWIGGYKFKRKIPKTHHEVHLTKKLSQDEVRNNIPKAKVGVLFTELKVEGFPQGFLEMTMCGVPVVYNRRAPGNKFYFHEDNSLLCLKEDIIKTAEQLLRNRDQVKCREVAIKNYSLRKSYKRILECLK